MRNQFTLGLLGDPRTGSGHRQKTANTLNDKEQVSNSGGDVEEHQDRFSWRMLTLVVAILVFLGVGVFLIAKPLMPTDTIVGTWEAVKKQDIQMTYYAGGKVELEKRLVMVARYGAKYENLEDGEYVIIVLASPDPGFWDRLFGGDPIAMRLPVHLKGGDLVMDVWGETHFKRVVK